MDGLCLYNLMQTLRVSLVKFKSTYVNPRLRFGFT